MFKLKAAYRLLAERKSEYIKRLKDMGIKPLGKGAFSDVFQHPTMPDVAVKIAVWNPGFMDYVHLCQQHPSNPYLLKILDVHDNPMGEGFNFEGDAGDRPGRLGRTSSTIVFVEKLTPATKEQLKIFMAYCESLIGIKPTGHTFDEMHGYDKEKTQKAFWSKLSKQTKDRNLQQFALWFMNALTRHNNRIPDMHDENIMMRGSQPVFSDPVS